MSHLANPSKKIRTPPLISQQGIKSWATDDRPREKLLMKGAEALSDAELLAILISKGTRDRSALVLARELLELAHRNWSELGKCSVREMEKVKGIGPSKASTIAAAMEIGRRRQAGPIFKKPVIANSLDAAQLLKPLLEDYRHEVFGLLLLNQGNRVIHFELISQGGISATIADPRIIFKMALDFEAVSLVLCHNHPSGNFSPSPADIALTQKLKEGGSLLDIKILDHIIITQEGYFSFSDDGLLA
ncbi:MAG: RadC family protein [Chitinophagaceae bacterium]